MVVGDILVGEFEYVIVLAPLGVALSRNAEIDGEYRLVEIFLIAVVAAAGKGERAGLGMNKVFSLWQGKSVCCTPMRKR